MAGRRSWVPLLLLLLAVEAAVSASQEQQPQARATRTRVVAQPLWLQDAVRSSKQPGLSSRQTGAEQAKPPPQAAPGQAVAAAPYIMLQRAHAVKHTHRVSAGKESTVRITSRGMRSGVLYKTSILAQGQAANVTVRVPDGNEYLGVGVFAWDLDPTANIDISLSLNSKLISESTNPAGLDDFLEAQEGVTAGEYTVTVKATSLAKASAVPVYVWLLNERKARAEIATPLPVTVSPNPVQLTRSPNCCSVTLSVGDIALSNMPGNRYIGILQYTTPDGRQLPGASPTMVYLL